MSRIKHPIRAIREPFGKAGLIVAVVALVLALTGAAFAAAGLNGKQKKEVEKIAKKFAGKPGAPGTNGAPGAEGKEGPEGKAGKNGTIGKEGPKGPEGSPWTAGGTLPSESTETGDWSLVGNGRPPSSIFATAVSFNVPLAAPPAPHYIRTTGMEPIWNHTTEEEEEVAQPACPGKASEPKAEPGNLCVYASHEEGSLKSISQVSAVLPKICSFGKEGGESGLCLAPAAAGDKTGFGLIAFATAEGFVVNTGTWAVTAE